MSRQSAATARRGTSSTTVPELLAELRRTRADLRARAAEAEAAKAKLEEQSRLLSAHLAADPGPAVSLETARQWAAEAYEHGYTAGAAAGCREPAEPLDTDPPGPWPVRTLGPLPQVDPDLDRRRYPPNGRARFAEPRPGDYKGRPRATRDTSLTGRS